MTKKISGITVLIMVGYQVQVNALTINFDYRFDNNNFFTQEVRQTLEVAAGFYEAVIEDQLTEIRADGSNSWRAGFRNPSNLASGFQYLNNMTIEANTMTVFVGAMDMSGSLGYAQSGYTSASGSDQFVNNTVSRGQGITIGADANDFATWGGAISFANDVDWNFGLTTENLNQTNHDFLTTATHELGHLFGFGSADTWFNLIDEDDYFTGAFSVAEYGSAVPTDGAAHWAEGVEGNDHGTHHDDMMDPSTPAGERQLLSHLDMAALRDIGWEITPVTAVPVPSAIWLFFSGILGLASISLRHKRRGG